MTPALSVQQLGTALCKFKLTLEVNEVAFPPTESFPLADDDSWHNLLSELWFTLPDRGQEHITNGTSWETVESCSNSSDSDHV